MTSKFSCEQIRDIAPEMALNITSGDDRAGVIAHISSCSKCRALVEDLSKTADAILLLGPEHEPPGGFESKVLAQFNAVRRSRRFVWLGAAAAVILAAALAAGSVLWVTADEREVAAHYQAALEEANGEYFGVKPLHADDGTKVGNVFNYGGHTSWLFVVFDDAEAGSYRVQLVTEGGERTDLGDVSISSSTETWGTDITVELRDVAALRFVTETGDTMAARFDDH